MAEPYSLFTFEGWYSGIRSLEAVMDSDMVPPAVAVSCAEMIRTGTTCFADQYFWMDQIVPEVRPLPGDAPGDHMYMPNARQLANGNYLVTHYGLDVVRDGVVTHHFDYRDGLADNEINGNAFAVDEGGRLWFCTMAGVSVVDPGARPRPTCSSAACRSRPSTCCWG